MGWLSGVEPELKASQASVLPLHHSHHVAFERGEDTTPIARFQGIKEGYSTFMSFSKLLSITEIQMLPGLSLSEVP